MAQDITGLAFVFDSRSLFSTAIGHGLASGGELRSDVAIGMFLHGRTRREYGRTRREYRNNQ